MQNEDSLTLLRLAREDTSSLRPLDDIASQTPRASTDSEAEDNRDVSCCFEFDYDILGSRVYRLESERKIRMLLSAQYDWSREAGEPSDLNENTTRDIIAGKGNSSEFMRT